MNWLVQSVGYYTIRQNCYFLFEIKPNGIWKFSGVIYFIQWNRFFLNWYL